MHLQTGHESEWLRRLRQTERRICRETNTDHYAAALTTDFTETQSAPARHRAGGSRTDKWAARFAAFATAIARWPTKAISRP